MGAGEGLVGEFVEGAGEAFRSTAVVDEDESRSSGADDFEQARIDRAPDGSALRALRGWAAWQFFDLAEAGHVFDGHLDLQFEALGLLGVDDGDGAKPDCRLALFAGGVLLFHLSEQALSSSSSSLAVSRRLRRGNGRPLRAGVGLPTGRCAAVAVT